MNMTTIRDCLQKVPFKKLKLKTDSGEEIIIKHPDCVMISEAQKTVVIDDGKHLHLIGVEHVSSVSF